MSSNLFPVWSITQPIHAALQILAEDRIHSWVASCTGSYCNYSDMDSLFWSPPWNNRAQNVDETQSQTVKTQFLRTPCHVHLHGSIYSFFRDSVIVKFLFLSRENKRKGVALLPSNSIWEGGPRFWIQSEVLWGLSVSSVRQLGNIATTQGKCESSLWLKGTTRLEQALPWEIPVK